VTATRLLRELWDRGSTGESSILKAFVAQAQQYLATAIRCVVDSGPGDVPSTGSTTTS